MFMLNKHKHFFKYNETFEGILEDINKSNDHVMFSSSNLVFKNYFGQKQQELLSINLSINNFDSTGQRSFPKSLSIWS